MEGTATNTGESAYVYTSVCKIYARIINTILYLSILLHYFTYNNTTSVTIQPRKLIYIFSFLSSQHVSALAGHHQVLLFMLKLSNCIAYHFHLVLLSTKLRYSLIIFIKIVLFKIFVSKLRL
jgi:hypothetical protein